MEEVFVTGLRELKRAALKAEDRMLARYNELNRDRDRDLGIVCSTGTPRERASRSGTASCGCSNGSRSATPGLP